MAVFARVFLAGTKTLDRMNALPVDLLRPLRKPVDKNGLHKRLMCGVSHPVHWAMLGFHFGCIVARYRLLFDNSFALPTMGYSPEESRKNKL